MKDKTRFLKSNFIYKAKRGHIYDPDRKRYNCYRPAINGAYYIIDCWPCDEAGNVHPGYNVSPSPVCQDNIGQVVNVIPRFE